MEFITQYSESVKKGTFEINNQPSMTEPDNAMSIPEIIARFTRGQGLAVQAKPWRSGSAPEPDGSVPDDVSMEAFFDKEASFQEPAAFSEPVPSGEQPKADNEPTATGE